MVEVVVVGVCECVRWDMERFLTSCNVIGDIMRAAKNDTEEIMM